MDAISAMNGTPLTDKILELKEKRNAVILAHNYQIGEVQDNADFLGDSLDLSQRAAESKAATIVFCGVCFMAEVAAILSPEKTVLIPDKNAGCGLADMITPRQLMEAKKKHPEAVIICYINSSVEIKALSDVCCTSANAVRIVERISPEKEILFIPDQSLGKWVAHQTGRRLIFWPGYCPTHHRFIRSEIEKLKKEHPPALVMVHPECTEEVIDLADAVLGTGGMVKLARKSPVREFIVGTEIGLLHRLKKENPGKKFYPASPFGDCPDMKLTTLEKILWSLEEMVYQVKVEEGVRKKAYASVQKMLQWS